MSSKGWLSAALLAGVLHAQTITTGEMTGTITDSSAALVQGAEVILKSADTGESRSTHSNGTGTYRFAFVRPGLYEISATTTGLRSDTGRVVVEVGQVRIADLALKPEGAKAVVVVTDAAPVLDTDNANIAYTVSTRQWETLPLPGGDLVGVAYSVPGVVINNRYGTGNFASQGVGSVSNLFTVNGVDDMDPYSNVNNSGTTGLLLGANEVSEASVVQNAYEGQYGRQAGAQVNYVTKSGTNSWHGNMVYSYNSTGMNANDFFGNANGLPRPPEVSNQYAASMGGRIVRNKLFFFVDTEGLRNGFGGTATVAAIPSPAFQAYALKTIQPSQTQLYQRMFALDNAAPGHDRAVLVTNCSGPLQDNKGHLGCGKLFGTPTGTGGTFGVDTSCAQAWGTTVPGEVWEWLLSGRVDYNLNAKQRMFFRFKTDQGYLPASNAFAINPLFFPVSHQPDYEGQVNHTFVISPRLVNNFIGSATYNSYIFGPSDMTAAIQLFPVRINISDGGTNNSRGLAAAGAPAVDPNGRRDGQLQIVTIFPTAWAAIPSRPESITGIIARLTCNTLAST